MIHHTADRYSPTATFDMREYIEAVLKHDHGFIRILLPEQVSVAFIGDEIVIRAKSEAAS